ncbi:hypothetical protein C483_02286 [Natrialba hulunbeirensis JCM 10989]|uniref:Uncharacterized protein n=1 Tax=Natrialba hulunbeirensis JCM 10989 TaxID=1227493 RepID=M0A8R6_9EURY|nr:hypothetical protein [Natrialba hulunbeirensis]ELY95155.1 hypothetical protein C483_02286 [Natrialba hulunbeirensis JCM 10989]
MAVSPYQQLSWNDPHTVYLSQIYALYSRQISWGTQLCDYGYSGYPDPKLENGSETYEPDLLAFNSTGDVQHITVEDFSNLHTQFENDSQKKIEIEDRLSDALKYANITDQMVTNYVELHGHDFTPSHHEIVITLSQDLYQKFEATISDMISENDLILWLINSNGTSRIWKELGTHSNMDLEDTICNKLEVYPNSSDLLHFTRNTDEALLKFEFCNRLIKHCSRERVAKVDFADIDRIMTQINPPMLGHLPRKERIKHWQKYMSSMLRRFNLMEKSKDQNQYKWKKESLIKEPRYCNRILRDIQDNLEISG